MKDEEGAEHPHFAFAGYPQHLPRLGPKVISFLMLSKNWVASRHYVPCRNSIFCKVSALPATGLSPTLLEK